jgi:hypothetical protein
VQKGKFRREKGDPEVADRKVRGYSEKQYNVLLRSRV